MDLPELSPWFPLQTIGLTKQELTELLRAHSQHIISLTERVEALEKLLCHDPVEPEKS